MKRSFKPAGRNLYISRKFGGVELGQRGIEQPDGVGQPEGLGQLQAGAHTGYAARHLYWFRGAGEPVSDYYPQALVVFCERGVGAAASVLRAAPTPHAAARLTPRRVVTLLKQAGRRNDAGLAEKISSTLRAEALRQPGPVEHALGVAAIGLIETITAMSDAIAALKAELATLFDQHAQASIITSFPDSGRSQR